MSDTRNSNTKPAERTRLRWHHEAPKDERGRVVPGKPFSEWVELVQPLDGRLEGLTAHIRLELVDGQIFVTDIHFPPDRPMPLDVTAVRAFRELRLGDLRDIAERCMERFGEYQIPGVTEWLDAFAAHRKRSGRHSTADHIYVRIAQRRIEAEEKSKGKAIRYMVKRWPDTWWKTETAVRAAVNKAIKKGFLEITPDGPRLTADAVEVLNRKPD